ncbi:hypothetical protein RHSIM_Rhsim07G0042700 [Rhododendron simsii]|uniref:HAT C-terminal dimerisation domain-containing protein n=1 Tax=Rhododendron simsii TaxID=118357 RepID=A0A834GS81_RHOSS|nr:hypothetical protein RHSIM_Rhsim07G0042700 [Rhododendron simsii]
MDPEHLHQGGRDHSDSESSDSSHDEHEATPSISPPQMGSIGEAGSNIVAAAGSTATGTCGAKKRRLTSYVWEHFQKVENFIDKHGISQGKRAVCNYCGSDFSCNSNHGTGSTDGLESIAPQIKNIRNALLFIATSGVRQQEFDALCKSYNVKPKRMKTDMKIRWNSTFLMLKSCRKHTDVITAFVNAKSNCSLTHSDWIIAFEFMKFLKVFYAATCALSGVRYPTSCLVLNHLYNISFTFNTYRTETNFVAACINMESKFKKYFKDMPKIFIVAAVMDPRIKLDAAQMLLDGISVNLMITLPSLTEVNSLLTNLYASYESKFASTTMATSVTSVPLPSTSSNDPSWSLISKKGKSASARSELVKYLEIERLTENNDLKNFDILDWWKKNERTFPILSIMARDVLTAPVSSVASESAFSAGKRVLDEKRSRLAPDILDCLLCLKDWEDARLGIQKRSAKDEFRDYFSDSDIDGDD